MLKSFKKTMRSALIMLLIGAMLFSVACSNKGGEEQTGGKNGEAGKPSQNHQMAAGNLSAGVKAGKVEGKAADQKFIAAQADFAVKLFQFSLNKSGNTLVSPLSVMIALAMTANGADGETLAGMEKALGGVPIDELNEYLYTYLKELPCGEKYKVVPANSIWIRKGLPVKEAFLQKDADYYGADAFSAPFDDSTLADINAWVKENTDGMIEKVLDEIREETVMYLINALIFEADWQSPYDEYSVHDADFRGINGTKTVEMMYSEESRYLEDGGAVGFIKPYADSKYSFAAIMPAEGTDINDYIMSLSGGKLLAILQRGQNVPVNAGLPKFSYDYELTLNNALKAMGMERAFDSGLADFSRMSENELYIGEVIHKTFIEVAEKGTRAGAVTVVAMDECAAIEMPETKTVILDRPFVYMLIDNATNLPIFIGAVTDIA